MSPGAEYTTLAEELSARLKDELIDPETRQPIVRAVYKRDDVYAGEYLGDASDLQVGFEEGYRVSWQTTLGGSPQGIVYPNMKKWSGDHGGYDFATTAGVSLTNRPILNASPRIVDIAPTVLQFFGIEVPGGHRWKAVAEIDRNHHVLNHDVPLFPDSSTIDFMSSKSRWAVFLVSTPLVVLVAIGGMLGASTEPQQRNDTNLAVFRDVLTLVMQNYVEPVDIDRVFEGAMRGLAEGMDSSSAYLTPDEVRAIESTTPMAPGRRRPRRHPAVLPAGGRRPRRIARRESGSADGRLPPHDRRRSRRATCPR